MLPDQQQPVDVPLAEPDRAGVGAARGPGRGDDVVQLSRHDCPQHYPQYHQSRMPRVLASARDVTILPSCDGLPPGHGSP